MRKVARNAMCMRRVGPRAQAKGWSRRGAPGMRCACGRVGPRAQGRRRQIGRCACERVGSVRAERTFFFPCMGGCSCAPFFSRRRPREITGGTTRKVDLARLHSASGLHGTNALAAATSREHVTIRTIRP